MNNEIEIWVYGEVGVDVHAEPIAKQLAASPTSNVRVFVNSVGGAVADGAAIYNALARHKGRVHVEIHGLAASIAGYIAMAGDEIEMTENAVLMIHSPWASADGNARAMRHTADTLDKVETSMVSAYRHKSGLSEDEVREIMVAETWYIAQEALDAGFVDKITEPLAIAASVDLSCFGNVPKRIVENLMAKADQAAGKAGETPNDKAAQAAVMEFQAKERARRTEIRNRLSPSLDEPGIREIYDAAIMDFSVTPDKASAQALAKMGELAQPLAGLSGGGIRADGTVPGQYSPDSHVSVSGDGGAFMAAATDGLLQRAGIAVKDPHPAARDLASASIGEVADICNSRAGRRFDFGESVADRIKAAQTTSDFPNILENIQEKAIIAGLEGEGIATHRAWTKPGDLADFKNASRVAMSEAPDLREVNEAGEITYGAIFDAGAEQIFLKTYAKGLSLSRQALINDDLGAFTRIPTMLGQSAARMEADLVYGILDTNPTMRDGKALFHADHGNLAATGGGITVETLSTARADMRRQRGPAGLAYLNIVPRFLICGADREVEALKVLSQLTPAKADDVTPQWIQQLQLVVDPRCDDQGNGAWYLAANPTTHDTIEVAFLDGRRAPSIERAEDFDNLNMKWRCVFDFGCAAIDWRGLYKNSGPDPD